MVRVTMQTFVAFLPGLLSLGEGTSLAELAWQLPEPPAVPLPILPALPPAPGGAPSAAPAYSPGPAGAPGGPGAPGPAAAYATVRSIQPMMGSICGGTKLVVHGSGFSHVLSENAVYLAGKPCTIFMASDTDIMCTTPAFGDKIKTEIDMHMASLSVTVRGVPIPVSLDLMFRYAASATPMVSTFGPVSGQGGDLLTFEGANFGGYVEVSIGDHQCEVKRNSDLFLQCIPAPAPTGLADVHFYAEGRGYACPGPKAPALKFLYSLHVQAVRPDGHDAPSMGSFGGGGSLVVVGQGFSDSDIVTLCDTSLCEKTSPTAVDPARFHQGDPSFQTFKCRPGRLNDPQNAKLEMTPTGPQMGFMAPPQDYNKTCQLTVTAAEGSLKASTAGAWTYSHQMTPEILKVARGSQGEGHIEIYGSGFTGPRKPNMEALTVKVGGVFCAISSVSAAKIDCQDSAAPPEGAIVTVYVPGFGDAIPAAHGADLVPKLSQPLAPLTLALRIPRPVPTVIPSKGDALKNNVAARCRMDHQLLDCPGGWSCCPNGGAADSNERAVPAMPGICAPACLSLLQQSK